MDGHHFTVHREWSVNKDTAAHAFERRKRLRGIGLGDCLRLQLKLLIRVLLALGFTLLQSRSGRVPSGSRGETACLQRSAVKAGAVIIVPLTGDFPTANNDTAMAVVERRIGCLLKAKREIVVRLHSDA